MDLDIQTYNQLRGIAAIGVGAFNGYRAYGVGDVTGGDIAGGAQTAADVGGKVGSGHDAKVLGDMASGAATGASVAGPWGAAAGAFFGLLGDSGGSVSPPWLDPSQIGQFAYDCFTVGASRGLMPWDIGAGLIGAKGPAPTYNDAATIHTMANNLLTEMLAKRPDLSDYRGVAQWTADGTMPKEVEDACFMIAQTYCTNANGFGFQGAAPWYTPFMQAKTWDCGESGQSVLGGVREAVHQLIIALPPPMRMHVSSVAASQALMNPNIKTHNDLPWVVAALGGLLAAIRFGVLVL